MSRSQSKLPYISLIFFQNRFLNKSDLNVRVRNSFIPSLFVNNKLKVHVFNGIWYLSVLMSSGMLGFKFGEFSFTKRSDRQTHLKKKRKKKSTSTKK
jgi:ribosomal protein S19